MTVTVTLLALAGLAYLAIVIFLWRAAHPSVRDTPIDAVEEDEDHE